MTDSNKESPCVTCPKHLWGCTCAKYRMWKAEANGSEYLRKVHEANHRHFDKPNSGGTSQ